MAVSKIKIVDGIFVIDDNQILDLPLLLSYITANDKLAKGIYKKLWDAYNNNYDIYKTPRKQPWKPDNRLSVNFAQYITDTFEGFFIGNPIKETSEDEAVDKYINRLDAYNDQDDQNAELSTLVSIFGRAYEMYYVNEDGEVEIAVLGPRDAFIIYDDSIKPKPKYFVRTYYDANGKRHGTISDAVTVKSFHITENTWGDDEHYHGFDGVPAVEYVQNSARKGIFENVLPLINAYNKALSEKANDVDYFADAYLKVLGQKLDEEAVKYLRESRVINFDGDAQGLVVDFMQKPNGDTTQENLLNRIERLIFIIAMVANISDENFATSSGIALRYKLLAMTNLAKKKERKFTSGMNRRYKLIFSNPVVQLPTDSWITIKYQFTPNIPNNIAEEAQTAQSLAGITSKKTQLSVLSVVDDVNAEIDQINKEMDEMQTEYDLQRLNDETNAEDREGNSTTE